MQLKTLSEEERQRLEAIVKQCADPFTLLRFYMRLGDNDSIVKHTILAVNAEISKNPNARKSFWLEAILEGTLTESDKGRMIAVADGSVILTDLLYTDIPRSALPQEAIQRIARTLYKEAISNGAHVRALAISNKFSTPLSLEEIESLREKIFYDVAVSYDSLGDLLEPEAAGGTTAGREGTRKQKEIYILQLRKATSGISQERVNAAANRAYKAIMKEGYKMSNYDSCARAAILAKEYLNNDRAVKALRFVVAQFQKSRFHYYNEYVLLKRLASFIKVPFDIPRNAVLDHLKDIISMEGNTAREVDALIREYKISSDEVGTMVRGAYRDAQNGGWFNKMLYLRTTYPSHIDDKATSLEDLQVLVELFQP